MIKSVALIVFIMIGAVLSVTIQKEDTVPEKIVYGNITVAELKGRMEKGKDIVLLDVRTPSEFKGPLGHLEGAMLIPVQELESRIAELDSLKNREIIVYCRSGRRSQVASDILTRGGFTVTNLVGGMKAWNKITELQKGHQPEEKK